MARSYVLGLIALAACGGSKTDAPTAPPPPPPPVVPAAVAVVTVSPDTATLAVQATVQLNAVLKDQNGNVLSGRTIAWSSASAGIATVTNAGLVSAIAPGHAVISATSEGKSASASITVSAPPVTPPQPPAFGMTWTETSDGVIDQMPTLGVISRPVMLSDGRTLAISATAGKYAERSAAGVWTAKSWPNGETISVIATSPNGNSQWAGGGNGTVLRWNGTAWVVDGTLGTGTIIDLSMADDGRGFAINPAGQVWSRSTTGQWAPVTPMPNPFPAFLVEGISTYAGDAAVVTINELQGGILANNYRVMRWNGSSWSDLGLMASAIKPTAAVLLADGTVVVGAETQPANSAAYRRRPSEGGWTAEWVDPLSETGASTKIIRCLDGTLLTFLRRGAVMRRSGTSWSQLLGGPATGTPLMTSMACQSAEKIMTTFATRGTVASVTTGQTVIERYRADLTRVSVGGSSNVLASAYASGVALVFNGSGWSGLQIQSESINSSESPGLTAWGTNGGMISSVGVVARRSGSTWTFEPRWVPSSGGVTLDGSVMYLTGADRSATYLGTSAYGSGLQRLTGNTLTDLSPGVSYTVGVPTIAADGTVGVSLVRSQSSRWARIVNGALAFDSIPNASMAGGARVLVGSATWAMIVTPNQRYTGTGLQYLIDAYVWSAGSYTLTGIPTAFNERITAAAIRRANEVYVFTSAKKVLAYDGSQWRSLGTTAHVINAAEIRGDFGVGVGEDGTVLYGRPTGSAVVVRRKR